MDSLGTAAGRKSVPHRDVQMEIVAWVQLVMTCLRGWTSESIAMWLELTGYRLDNAFHCKVTNSRNKHEFVISEFTDDKKRLKLRTDRFERKGSMWISPFSSPYQVVRDTITRINGHPPHSNVLRTITFKGDRAKRPSLWDVMILANVVHNDSTIYTLMGRQSHWFADTIFGLLEKWATIYNNEATTTDEKEKLKRRARGRQGSIGLVPVHRRDPVHVNKIWDDFTREKQTMGKQVSLRLEFLFAALTRGDLAGGV